MVSDNFTITVKIAARSIRLTIPRDEEEKYRLAAKHLNAVINFYQQKFAEVDMEMILLMAAYHVSVEHQGEQQKTDMSPLLEKVIDLNNTLEQHVNPQP